MSGPRSPLDIGAVWRLISRSSSRQRHIDPHITYVPDIRSHVLDAQQAARDGDTTTMRRRGADAITLSLLIDRGQHPDTPEHLDAARRDARRLMGLDPAQPPGPQPRPSRTTSAALDEDRFSDADRATLIDHAATAGRQDVATAARLGVQPRPRPTSELVAGSLWSLGLTRLDLRNSEIQWVTHRVQAAYQAAFTDAQWAASPSRSQRP